jgi:DNA helicase-2/ATP-dependent DNA helicase PcrA
MNHHLTSEQEAAIEHRDGPAMVLSGPGSGKTTVVTRRIAHLIESGEDPSSIVAITFTRKASREMAERVAKLVPSGVAKKVWISTFHAFGARVLRAHPRACKLTSEGFSIADQAASLVYMKEAAAKIIGCDPSEVTKKGGWQSLESISRRISQFKQDCVLPYQVTLKEEYESIYRLDFFQQVYAKYQELLKRSQSVDFNDLIMKVVLAWGENEGLRRKYSSRFRWVMVDEYQDTSHMQYRFLRLLTDVYHNPFVVGDIDQSIYRFRGADIGNILSFEKDFPGAYVYRLESNFRSTKAIARAANALIARNRLRKEKEIKATREEGVAVRYVEVPNQRVEAKIIAQEIVDFCRARKAKPGDFAVLYRLNLLSRDLEEALVRANVPYKVLKGVGFYSRAVILDVLAYLRLVVNPSDDAAMLRIYNNPTRGIGARAMDHIVCLRTEMEQAAERPVPLIEAFRDARHDEELSTKAKDGIEDLLNVLRQGQHEIKRVGGSGKESVGRMVELVLEHSGYMAHLEKTIKTTGSVKVASEAKSKVEHLQELKFAAQDFDSRHGGGLIRYHEWVTMMQADTDQEVGNRVALSTVHSAKGLEWQHVYVVCVVEDVMPSLREISFDGSLRPREEIAADLEEERRLLFVALTRAKDGAALMCPEVRRAYSGIVNTEASRFISEIGAQEEMMFQRIGFGGF